jgi:hypothetical protein
VILIEMVFCPPIAIFDIGSYYAMNMIHTTNIWVFMLLILSCFLLSARIGQKWLLP